MRYEKETQRLYELIDPESLGELYMEVMSKDTDDEKMSEHAEAIVGKMSQISNHLPKNLSEYVSEKIQYNIKQRDLEDMDADHPNPEEEFKRDFEK